MLSTNKLVFLFLQSIALFTEIYCERDFVINIDSITCTHNPVYIKTSNCSTDKSFGRSRGYIDIEFQQDLLRPLYSTEIIFRYGKTVRKMVSIKNGSVCDFLEGKSLVSFIRLYRHIFNKFGVGKLPKRCPVKKEYHFLMKGIEIEEDKIVPFAPNGNFTVDTTVHSAKEFFCRTILYGTVSRKRIEVIR